MMISHHTVENVAAATPHWDLARCGAWLAVTRGPLRGHGAVGATQTAPQVIKLEDLSVSPSARAKWSGRLGPPRAVVWAIRSSWGQG